MLKINEQTEIRDWKDGEETDTGLHRAADERHHGRPGYHCPSTPVLSTRERQLLAHRLPSGFSNTKGGSELLPMCLTVPSALSFLIAVCVNTVRFHKVLVQHIGTVSLGVFAAVHAEAGRQIPAAAPKQTTLCK